MFWALGTTPVSPGVPSVLTLTPLVSLASFCALCKMNRVISLVLHLASFTSMRFVRRTVPCKTPAGRSGRKARFAAPELEGQESPNYSEWASAQPSLVVFWAMGAMDNDPRPAPPTAVKQLYRFPGPTPLLSTNQNKGKVPPVTPNKAVLKPNHVPSPCPSTLTRDLWCPVCVCVGGRPLDWLR